MIKTRIIERGKNLIIRSKSFFVFLGLFFSIWILAGVCFAAGANDKKPQAKNDRIAVMGDSEGSASEKDAKEGASVDQTADALKALFGSEEFNKAVAVKNKGQDAQNQGKDENASKKKEDAKKYIRQSCYQIENGETKCVDYSVAAGDGDIWVPADEAANPTGNK